MSTTTKAWICFLFICIAWGTTFLGIKWGLLAMPPFLMAGSRQFIAGIIILALAFINPLKKDYSLQNIAKQGMIGFLLITLGNGLVSWGEAYIPSGLAAILCAVMPLISVLLSLLTQKNEKINGLIVVGMLLGLTGIAINFKDSLKDLSNVKYLMGMIAVFIATITWALGSIISKKHKTNSNPIFNSALQVSIGGAFLLIISPFVDDYSAIDLSNQQGMLSILYLIVVGSVLAFLAFNYALKHLPVGIVMVYAYINPVVAVILAWLLAGESLNLYTGISFACIILGVFLVNRGYQRIKDQQFIKNS